MQEQETLFETEAQAAAYLLAERLNAMGTVDTAWVIPGSRECVAATTHGQGPHLMNEMHDIDADVHLICETQGVIDAGNLPDEVDEEDCGPIYFNFQVFGIEKDYNGYGLPTHAALKHGAEPKKPEELGSKVLEAARMLGTELDE